MRQSIWIWIIAGTVAALSLFGGVNAQAGSGSNPNPPCSACVAATLTDPTSGKPLIGDVSELQQAISDGWAITPTQAIQALQQFWGDPTLVPTVRGVFDEGAGSRFGFNYTLDLMGGSNNGSFLLRVSDGALVGMSLEYPQVTEGAVPVVDLPTARAAAIQFAQAHCPNFDPTQWLIQGSGYIIAVGFEFSWYQVLSAAGALAPLDLRVSVDKFTGQVISFAPPSSEPVNCPTTPQITSAQAIQAALPYAYYNPAQFPFTPTLQVVQDPIGVDALAWILIQAPRSDFPFHVTIDAITGAVTSVSQPLASSAASTRNREAIQRLMKRDVSTGIRVRSAEGKTILSFYPPEMRGGKIWIRAEFLAALNARVKADPKKLEIRLRKRLVTGVQIGAEYRKSAWWVPVRSAADALGWPVSWLPGKQEVDVRQSIPLSRMQLH